MLLPLEGKWRAIKAVLGRAGSQPRRIAGQLAASLDMEEAAGWERLLGWERPEAAAQKVSGWGVEEMQEGEEKTWVEGS